MDFTEWNDAHLSSHSTHALTRWGRVTRIFVSKVTTIGSDNGLSPGRLQTVIWTSDGILLIEPFGTNFREILIEIYMFSLKEYILKCRQVIGNHFYP